MDFDGKSWRAKVSERLQNSLSKIPPEQTSVYTFLAAETLWPLVEEARRSEKSAFVMLGRVLASGPCNHLPTLIENWKLNNLNDNVAQELSTAMTSIPGLSDEIHTVLEAVGTISQAWQTLPEKERPRFLQRLTADLDLYCSNLRIEPQLPSLWSSNDSPKATAATELYNVPQSAPFNDR